MRRIVALLGLVALAVSCSSSDDGGGGGGPAPGECADKNLCYDICQCATGGDNQKCTQSCQQNGCSSPSCGDCGSCFEICICVNGGQNQVVCQQACDPNASGGAAGQGGAGANPGSGGTGATSAACDDGSGWDPSWQSFECQVLDLTNQRRARGAICGDQSYPPVAPLAPHPLLTQSARGHAKDMGDNGFFSHTNLQGQNSADRIWATGYEGSPVGENIAAGQGSPAQVVEGWMKSEGHCQNIMNGNYANLGVGYYFAPNSQYEHYWVQNFGG